MLISTYAFTFSICWLEYKVVQCYGAVFGIDVDWLLGITQRKTNLSTCKYPFSVQLTED